MQKSMAKSDEILGASAAIKVLHLTLSFSRGGRRIAIEGLSNGLRRLGVRCSLACVDELGCDGKEVARLFEDVHVLARRSLVDSRALSTLVTLCEDQGINIIHAHDA